MSTIACPTHGHQERFDGRDGCPSCDDQVDEDQREQQETIRLAALQLLASPTED